MTVLSIYTSLIYTAGICIFLLFVSLSADPTKQNKFTNQQFPILLHFVLFFRTLLLFSVQFLVFSFLFFSKLSTITMLLPCGKNKVAFALENWMSVSVHNMWVVLYMYSRHSCTQQIIFQFTYPFCKVLDLKNLVIL